MEEPNKKQESEQDFFQPEQEQAAFEKENERSTFEIKRLRKAQKRFRSNKIAVGVVRVIGILVWIIVVLTIHHSIGLKADEKISSLKYHYEMDASESDARISRFQKQIVQQLSQASVKDGPHILTERNRAQMDSYISSLHRCSADDVELRESGGIHYYLVKKQKLLDGHDLTDTKNSSIFPGAVIKGDSLFKGADYTLIAAERTPMQIVSNQSNGQMVQVDDVNYANVTLALQAYQNSFQEENPKEWSYSFRSIASSEEMEFSLGLKAANVGFGFSKSSTEEQSTIAVVYSQNYYTVSAEPLKSASQYFTAGTNLDILGAYEPAYVSSVSYGRKIIIFVTGELSQDKLSAKLNAAVQGVGVEAGIKKICTDEELSYWIYQYGGSTPELDLLISNSREDGGFHMGKWLKETWNEFWNGSEEEESISEKINNVIDFNAALTNPVPISYELKYLSDNEVVPNVFLEGQNVILIEDAQSASFEDILEAVGDRWY